MKGNLDTETIIELQCPITKPLSFYASSNGHITEESLQISRKRGEFLKQEVMSYFNIR